MKNEHATNNDQMYNAMMDNIEEYINRPVEFFSDMLAALHGANAEAEECGGSNRQALDTLTITMCHNVLSKYNDLFCKSNVHTSLLDTEPTSHHFNAIRKKIRLLHAVP